MDLRSLGGSTWRGFSDQELQGIKKPTSSPSTPVADPSTSSGQEEQSLNNATVPTSTVSTCTVSESEPRVEESPQQQQQQEEQQREESHDLVEPAELFEEQVRRRREIEEANKKKKKALEETLSQRYQQSRAESNKLETVKSELAKLDQLVTKDVAILRDTIETASRDYTTAKLRFERAETEYVSAKLALATAKEKKDLLSQHLCSVIQENEQRKATKLTQLMTKLDIHEQS